MKKSKRVFIIILVVLSFIITVLAETKTYASSNFDFMRPAEYTEEYKEYLKLSEEEQKKRIPPRKYEISKIENTNILRKARDNFESRYSLKDIIPENVIVKNQRSLNICWAFATLSSLETNLALNNIGNHKVYDFSERHMDYALSNIYAKAFERKPGGGISGYTSKELVTAYLTNGTGAVDEKEMPFENNSKTLDISEIKSKTVTSQVYDTIYFPSYDQTEDTTQIMQDIKNHIKNYGAVRAAIHGAQPTSEYVNNKTGAIYCDNKWRCPINHEVSIIGWDDDYSVSNFNINHRPKNNGAWIIKNSWGDTIGDKGFMYMSYEDVNIYKDLFGIIKASDSINYENIYQYDELGATFHMLCNREKIYVGEIFSKKTTETEYITQVGIQVPDKSTCKVYVNPNGTSKAKQDLQLVSLKDGEMETFNTGYHTLEFLKPVKITGNEFAIVIETVGHSNRQHPYVGLSLEANNDKDAKVEFQDCLQTAFGKCFVTDEEFFEKDEWLDISEFRKDGYYDASIKAFTVSKIENTPYTITFDYRNGKGTMLNKEVESNQTYGELPKAIRLGYTFNGWYTKTEGQGEKIEGITKVNITSDTTLYAHWIANQYTVTFNPGQDGIVATTSRDVTYDKPYGKLPTPVKPGSIFKGWVDTNGKQVIQTDIVKITGNTTLTALWEKEKEKLYLKSEKYKIGENDINTYEKGDIYLDKIEPKTTFAQFTDNCETNGTIIIINQNGNILEENDFIGTNMTIKVTRDNEKIETTAVVMGDIDGNGKVTISDLSQLNKVILKTETLEGAQFNAVDLDNNKKITISDSSTENQVILGITELKYNKNINK